jgi:hypothetical protein
MTDPTPNPAPPETDKALRRLIIARAKTINGKLLARLATVADDLDAGHDLAALGGLDGIEREIHIMRSFLLLLR